MQDYELNSLYINPTKYCNLRCCHCWLSPPYKGIYSDENELSPDELIGITQAAIPLGLTSVKLTGGEPLLRDDLVPLLEFCKEKKLDVIIETNGTLINEKKASLLWEAGIEFISVSLDGVNSDINDSFRGAPGAFDSAIKGIKNLINVGFYPQVITCLHRRNLAYFDEFIDLLNQLGVYDLKINIINYVGRAQDSRQAKQFLSVREILEFSETLPEIEKKFPHRIRLDIPAAFKKLEEVDIDPTCGILGILGILSNGDVSICGIGTHIKELVFGSLKGDTYETMQEKLKDIWFNHPKLKQLRQDVTANLQGVCRQCVLKARCLGKCRAESYYHHGNFTAADWFCQQAFEEGLFPKLRLIPEELLTR